jgi:hypothetical protein
MRSWSLADDRDDDRPRQLCGEPPLATLSAFVRAGVTWAIIEVVQVRFGH